MKNWVVKLLSDANGLPSTRLHLAWGLFGSIMYGLYKGSDPQNIQTLAYTMAVLAGVSVFDKGVISKK